MTLDIAPPCQNLHSIRATRARRDAGESANEELRTQSLAMKHLVVDLVGKIERRIICNFRSLIGSNKYLLAWHGSIPNMCRSNYNTSPFRVRGVSH